MELLLLPGGAAAAGLPVVVLRCSRRGGRARVGVAVRCPVCTRVSVNLVSHEHVDLPFHNDREIGVVRHVFCDEPVEDGFGSLLASSEIDGRRLEL